MLGGEGSMLGGEGRRPTIALALVMVLLALPALVVDVAPLSDFPDHLTRVHVLTRGATWWAPAWDLLPNLAVDLAGVALAPALGLEWFGRTFLVATVVVWCLGCRALGRALVGRDSTRALIACGLVWSEPLLLGYAGFTMSAGVALLAIAAFARGLRTGAGTGTGTGTGAGPWILTAALGLLTALAHAAGAAILVAASLALIAVDVATRRALRREAQLALAALVPAVVYVGQWWLRRATHDGVSFATPGMITRALVSPVTGLDHLLDLASLGLVALLAVAALWRARPLVVRWGPAGAAAACLVLVVVFPSDVAGGIEVHGRFALGAWALGLFAVDRRAALDVPATSSAPAATGRAPAREAASDRPRRDLVALAALVLMAARTLHLAGELRVLDLEARAIRSLLARSLPPRASLAVVWFFPADRMPTADRVRALATLHVPSLAVVDRDAHVPMLYALPGVQPIRALGDLPRARRFLPSGPGPDVAGLAGRFDFVWLCGGPTAIERELLVAGARVGSVGRCTLIETRRDDVASSGTSGGDALSERAAGNSR